MRDACGMSMQSAVVADVFAALPSLRRKHVDCDDYFYACLKRRAADSDGDTGNTFYLPDGEINEDNPCTCGADAHNAKVDELVCKLRVVTDPSTHEPQTADPPR